MFKKLIISPPFGNVFRLSSATSVCGTYTLDRRPGMALRYLANFRPLVIGNKLGWVNAIGLRNPGLSRLSFSKSEGRILSISLLNQEDFPFILSILENFMFLQHYAPAALEINVSCPNADVMPLTSANIAALQSLGLEVIVKIPPSKQHVAIIEHYQNCGVRYFHLFNSFSTSKGGVSGAIVKNYYLFLLRKAHKIFGDSIQILGGGGIQSMEDVLQYRDAGASFFSISTLFCHPVKLLKFLQSYRSAEEKGDI